MFCNISLYILSHILVYTITYSQCWIRLAAFWALTCNSTWPMRLCQTVFSAGSMYGLPVSLNIFDILWIWCSLMPEIVTVISRGRSFSMWTMGQPRSLETFCSWSSWTAGKDWCMLCQTMSSMDFHGLQWCHYFVCPSTQETSECTILFIFPS